MLGVSNYQFESQNIGMTCGSYLTPDFTTFFNAADSTDQTCDLDSSGSSFAGLLPYCGDIDFQKLSPDVLSQIAQQTNLQDTLKESANPRKSPDVAGTKIAEPDSTFSTPSPLQTNTTTVNQTPPNDPDTSSSSKSSPRATPSPSSEQSSSGETVSPPDGEKIPTKRKVFTQSQLSKLEKRFIMQSFLSREERFELAAELNITERQVMVWFQNRRGRLKKRGPADTAYNPIKLNELNTRRPYPFLYGMLSSMHYQNTNPHQQMWSQYPDDVRNVAASAMVKSVNPITGLMPPNETAHRSNVINHGVNKTDSGSLCMMRSQSSNPHQISSFVPSMKHGEATTPTSKTETPDLSSPVSSSDGEPGVPPSGFPPNVTIGSPGEFPSMLKVEVPDNMSSHYYDGYTNRSGTQYPHEGLLTTCQYGQPQPWNRVPDPNMTFGVYNQNSYQAKAMTGYTKGTSYTAQPNLGTYLPSHHGTQAHPYSRPQYNNQVYPAYNLNNNSFPDPGYHPGYPSQTMTNSQWASYGQPNMAGYYPHTVSSQLT